MEERAITTSISCAVSGAEGHLSAEVDSRYWGYNHGKSQYFPGDSAYVLVFRSDNVEILGTGHSGNCTFGGQASPARNAGNDDNTAGNYHAFMSGTVAPYRVMETITFSNPVGNSSKPIGAVYSKNWSSYGGSFPIIVKGTTLCYCKEWEVPLVIAAVPSWGFLTIDYEVVHDVFSFHGMQLDPGRVSGTCYGTIYGLASPIYP